MTRRTPWAAAAALCLLAGPVAAQSPPDGSTHPIDSFLTPEARAAVRSAAADPELWAAALEDGGRFLEAQGIDVPKDLRVDFLDIVREGDLVRFTRPGEEVDTWCPPERTWWRECRKVVRACESVTICVKFDPLTHACISADTVEKNCAFVCEESLGEDTFSMPLRPPFPPLPH